MSKKVINDSDIIKVIDNAVLLSKLYGYGMSLSEEEETINDTLMNFLEKKISREEYIQLEEQVSELINASETAGFKRGFHIAMRIVIDGLKVEN